MPKATLTGKQVKKFIELFEDTPHDQIQDLFGSGLLTDLRDANIAGVNRDEFRRVCGFKSLVTPEQPDLLLEFLGTVTIPAITERFIAKDRFVINTNNTAKVKISFLGSNFTEWFLNGDSKIEESISEQTLRYAKLCRFSVDGPIIAELGGEAKAETTLSAMFSLMEKQKNGKAGALLNNGYANIFYIKDINGTLRAVIVYWFDDGWYMYASSVEYPFRWFDGYQVFSSNS